MSRRHQRGQALVEFAVSVPLIMLVLLGFFKFAAAMYQYDLVDNAARIGTRYAIVHGSTCTQCGGAATSSTISAYVILHSSSMLSTNSPLTVVATWPGNGGTCASGSKAAGCPVNVSVTSQFSFLGFSKQLSSQSNMIISQ
jgi:Flp pilus assembly protein TadG